MDSNDSVNEETNVGILLFLTLIGIIAFLVVILCVMVTVLVSRRIWSDINLHFEYFSK
jgi:hypothetical protein